MLATLTGAAPGTDQALFVGNVGRGNTTDGFALRRPYLRLRKGQLFDNQPSKIKSISLPTTNMAASGAGSMGRGRAISGSTIVFTVEFDNESLPWHTAVTVTGTDRPGLLQAVSTAFATAEMVVHTARVATTDGQANDRFAVTDRIGRKVTAEQVERMTAALAKGGRPRRSLVRR